MYIAIYKSILTIYSSGLLANPQDSREWGLHHILFHFHIVQFETMHFMIFIFSNILLKPITRIATMFTE